MAKMSTSLVFLREAEPREDRSSETGRLSESGGNKDIWFEDGRTNPKGTATYLKRLGYLRKELFHREHDNRLQAVQRLNDGSHNQETSSKRYHTVRKQNANQGFPERHKKLQQQRKFELEKHRQGPLDTSRNLEPLKGEKVSVPTSSITEDLGSSHVRYSDISDDLQKLIELQRMRIVHAKERHVRPSMSTSPISVVSSNMSSIPNLEMKTFRPSDKLVPIGHENQKRSDSFVRQKALHHKDSKGIYRGQNHSLLRADMDEIDLHPQNVRFDMTNDTHYRTDTPNGQRRLDKYSAPLSTPVHWEVKGGTSGVKPKGKSGPTSKYSQVTKTTQKISPRPDQAIRNPQQQAYLSSFTGNTNPNASLLRTMTSLYAPTWQGYIRVARRTAMQPIKVTQTPKRSSFKSSSGADEASSLSSVPQNNASAGGYGMGRPHAEVMYDYPRAVPMQAENGDIILVNSSTADLEYHPNNLTAIQHDANFTSPQSSRPSSTPSERRVNLVVDIPRPDIVLNPPSPNTFALNRGDEEQTSSVSLRKTFRQNELREKEISDLLDDVKELNEVTQVAENKLKDTEDERDQQTQK